ncbi:uncharacterized protein LOC134188801 isoform X2 [Corticium candelabrum]|uniref:uncharacterized protein LOC134188801 isoform X2 n=1 Tax=Corticium candelabrum TaxID=121492 RepID=UPI002E26B0F6|nr:uncharacterized protein LOC134188801 isoform X2 [Corticium candelabrum]
MRSVLLLLLTTTCVCGGNASSGGEDASNGGDKSNHQFTCSSLRECWKCIQDPCTRRNNDRNQRCPSVSHRENTTAKLSLCKYKEKSSILSVNTKYGFGTQHSPTGQYITWISLCQDVRGESVQLKCGIHGKIVAIENLEDPRARCWIFGDDNDTLTFMPIKSHEKTAVLTVGHTYCCSGADERLLIDVKVQLHRDCDYNGHSGVIEPTTNFVVLENCTGTEELVFTLHKCFNLSSDNAEQSEYLGNLSLYIVIGVFGFFGFVMFTLYLKQRVDPNSATGRCFWSTDATNTYQPYLCDNGDDDNGRHDNDQFVRDYYLGSSSDSNETTSPEQIRCSRPQQTIDDGESQEQVTTAEVHIDPSFIDGRLIVPREASHNDSTE